MANNKSIQFLRGSGHDQSVTLEAGQPYYDKTNNLLFIGKGATTIANSNPVNTLYRHRIILDINSFVETDVAVGSPIKKGNAIHAAFDILNYSDSKINTINSLTELFKKNNTPLNCISGYYDSGTLINTELYPVLDISWGTVGVDTGLQFKVLATIGGPNSASNQFPTNAYYTITFLATRISALKPMVSDTVTPLYMLQ